MKDGTCEDKYVRGDLPQEVRCIGRKREEGGEQRRAGWEGVRKRGKRTFWGREGEPSRGRGQTWGPPTRGSFHTAPGDPRPSPQGLSIRAEE